MTTLGTTGIEVFPLVLGTNTFGWTSDEAASHAVLDAFVGGGGNFVDTADAYSAWADGHVGGESETVIGSWLEKRGRRDDVLIGTKVSQHPDFQGLSASTVARAADASLRRLRTDHIDVYYAHFDDESTPLEETAGAFESLRSAGKVRYVALSNYSAARVRGWAAIAAAEGWAAPVALQPRYNLVSRSSFEGELAQAAAELELGVVPYFALASGFLTGSYRTIEDVRGSVRGRFTEGFFSARGLDVVDELEDIAHDHGVSIAAVALAWLCSKPTITAPIASARGPEQLAELMKVAEVSLSLEDLARLDRVSAAVDSSS